jgi:putative Mg2+ transporter-C (MgtC) family protein
LTLPHYDWTPALENLGKIALAYILALPIGWNREQEGPGLGIRTFPIVAMASCGYLLVLSTSRDFTSMSRVLQGLVAGIGFIGGGAIVRDGITVHGAATAASIWTTGAMGAAIALERYEVALLLMVLDLFTLKALLPLKKKLEGKGE